MSSGNLATHMKEKMKLGDNVKLSLGVVTEEGKEFSLTNRDNFKNYEEEGKI